jgi:nucleotide-binding universal stress UspA family protein
MLPIHKILHPTDFSERSETAFRLACTLARDNNVPLVLLHVHSPFVAYGDGLVAALPPEYTSGLREELRTLDPHDARVVIERHLVEGDPAMEILRMAREADCDLIVMGTHGRTGLGRLLMGSVAEAVVRKAACPVLTIKTPTPMGKSVHPTLQEVGPGGAK